MADNAAMTAPKATDSPPNPSRTSRPASPVPRSLLTAMFLGAFTLITFGSSFSTEPFRWINDAWRYLAQGVSIVEDGMGFPKPMRYSHLATLDLYDKTWSYPGQLFELIAGAAVSLFDAPPQLSTIVFLNLFAIAGCFLVIFQILRLRLAWPWALSATALLGSPLLPSFFNDLAHYATEPWAMLCLLLSLQCLLKGSTGRAGCWIGAGYFFRAQIVQFFLAATLSQGKRWKALLTLAAGTLVVGFGIRTALGLAFPRLDEGTSSFYLRVFFEKYPFSLGKGVDYVLAEPSLFAPLLAALGIAAFLWVASRGQNHSKETRRCARVALGLCSMMAVFVFYMACTIGDSVQTRYYVYAPPLLWITFCFLLAERTPSLFQSSPRLAWIPALVVLGWNGVRIDPDRFATNLYGEDIPPSLFAGIGKDAVFVTGSGAPLAYLHTGSRSIFALPSVETFEESDNRNADYLLLDTKREAFGGDWAQHWESDHVTDGFGNRFERWRQFDSGIRTSRLFRRVTAETSGTDAPRAE